MQASFPKKWDKRPNDGTWTASYAKQQKKGFGASIQEGQVMEGKTYVVKKRWSCYADKSLGCLWKKEEALFALQTHLQIGTSFININFPGKRQNLSAIFRQVEGSNNLSQHLLVLIYLGYDNHFSRSIFWGGMPWHPSASCLPYLFGRQPLAFSSCFLIWDIYSLLWIIFILSISRAFMVSFFSTYRMKDNHIIKFHMLTGSLILGALILYTVKS